MTDERLAKLHIALELCIRLSEESEPTSTYSVTRKGLGDVFAELKASRQEIAVLKANGDDLASALWQSNDELAPLVRTDHEALYALGKDAYNKWHSLGDYFIQEKS